MPPPQYFSVRNPLFAYLGTALIAGTASIVFGSIICVAWVVFSAPTVFASPDPGIMILSYLFVLWVWLVWSCIVVFPLSVILGFPIMFLLRRHSRWVRWLIGTFAGALLPSSLVVFLDGWTNEILGIAAYGAIYGTIFGLVASILLKPDDPTGIYLF